MKGTLKKNLLSVVVFSVAVMVLTTIAVAFSPNVAWAGETIPLEHLVWDIVDGV